jgi:hypothetical protein
MKRFPLFFAVTASALMTAALSGCATDTSDQAGMHRGGGPMEMKDMQSMCDMHKKMMASKTPAEREAMMGGQTMSPEMKKHMMMMQEQCK